MLTISNLNQYYGGSHILRDVAFDIPKGACTAVLGRNGVGKTTLLKCLVGLLPIRSGVLTLDGKSIAALPPYERARLGIGYVPQGREIFPRLTVEENLLMGLASKPGGGKVPERIYEMFPVLKDMLRRRGGDLSGGQQQQLAIGRVISTLAKSGEMAILLVEQYYDFARELADHYVVMSRGEVIKAGPGGEMDKENVKGMLAI